MRKIAHYVEAYDSICFNILDEWNKFLAQNPETPDSAAELERRALIKLIVTGGRDPDGVATFQRWRPVRGVRNYFTKNTPLLPGAEHASPLSPSRWDSPLSEVFYVAGDQTALHQFVSSGGNILRNTFRMYGRAS